MFGKMFIIVTSVFFLKLFLMYACTMFWVAELLLDQRFHNVIIKKGPVDIFIHPTNTYWGSTLS